ncbi:hypothetical protein M3Y99_01471300 [Aphelenchoides fujianensis]|nr:hypothetical protein M3Y99_01471300 [Aphelenchoides fujianensis]
MASSSRKRAVDAAEDADEEPLIRQLSSARPVGCAMCWNPSRQTAQTAKKKPKMKTLKESPADEQPIGSSEFVYQTCGLDEDLRFSPDGRHMYTFTKDGSLLVVDLFHGKQKIFKSPKGRKERGISYFVALNSTTVLLLSMAEGGRRDADYAELELLRLSEHRDVFEAVLLERTKNAPLRTWVAWQAVLWNRSSFSLQIRLQIVAWFLLLLEMVTLNGYLLFCRYTRTPFDQLRVFGLFAGYTCCLQFCSWSVAFLPLDRCIALIFPSFYTPMNNNRLFYVCLASISLWEAFML